MSQAIDIAVTQLGVHEATGKNDGIPANRYMGGDQLAWCAGFVLYCNEHSDVDTRLARTMKDHYRMRSVTALMVDAKVRGWWFARGTKDPQRNDIIIFGETASDVGVTGSHTGIVETVTASMVSTIEGNTGNKVARRSYPLGARSILGYIRVPPRV